MLFAGPAFPGGQRGELGIERAGRTGGGDGCAGGQGGAGLLLALGEEQELGAVELVRMVPDRQSGELLRRQIGQAVIEPPIGLDGNALAQFIGEFARRLGLPALIPVRRVRSAIFPNRENPRNTSSWHRRDYPASPYRRAPPRQFARAL